MGRDTFAHLAIVVTRGYVARTGRGRRPFEPDDVAADLEFEVGVGKAQPVVGAPPLRDRAPVVLEEGAIADQAGPGDIRIGVRHCVVENERFG